MRVVALLLTSLFLANAEDESLRRLRKANVIPIDSIIDESMVKTSLTGWMDPVEYGPMWRDLVEMSLSMSFSMSMSMDMDTTCSCSDDCLPLDASPFNPEASVDIGSTGKEGSTTRCGPNCYILKGSGLDVCANDLNDASGPDSMHFAYTKASGPFILVSKVCGTSSGDSFEDIAPRAGLMVRDSLDPMSSNFFLSHTPEAEANWSARRETNGTTSCNFDGSPDVPCLYLVIERFTPGDGEFEFIGYYSYEVDFLAGVDSCSKRETIFEVAFTGFSFSEEVYVGMAVLYGKDDALYESQFNEVHFASDNQFRDMPFTSRYTI